MTEFPSVGESANVLLLKELRDTQRINIYLYMDESVARGSSVVVDLEKYRLTDIDFRPVLEINDWLKSMQKQMKQIAGPSANIYEMLKEQPLFAEVLEDGFMDTAVGSRRYLKCLLPFLDEMEEIEIKNATGIKR